MHKIFIEQYLKNINLDGLKTLANRYNITLSDKEAKEILPFIHQHYKLLLDYKNKDTLINLARQSFSNNVFDRAMLILDEFEKLYLN